jgi:hypothetical protein
MERRCRYCERSFQPSKFQTGQASCSQPECQRRRRADYRRQKLAADREHRQTCFENARKWRARNPRYWRRYREQHPSALERNRQQQHVRDQKQRLRELANNNLAPARVWVLEALPPRRKLPASESCKQQSPDTLVSPAR